MNIPKIIHQIWFQGESEIPPHLNEYRRTWKELNPEFKMMFWDKERIEFLVNKTEWSDVYYSSPLMIQKIDIAKYIILLEYGGIYIDIDIKCIKPIRTILSEGKNVLL